MNPRNCESRRLGRTGVVLEDIAFCKNRKFYGVAKNKLYSIDTLRARTTEILTLSPSFDLNGLACDSSSNIIAASSAGQIIKIDPQLLTYSITSIFAQGCEGDITFIGDSLYIAAPGATLYSKPSISSNDSSKIGEMASNSHVLGLATLFNQNPYGLKPTLVSTQHFSLHVTSPETGFTIPICSKISFVCIRGATSATDTNGYKFMSQFAQYLQPIDIVMPNVFSPNNDSFNDRFIPIKLKGPIVNTYIEIVNRWGVTIFSTTDLRKGWDGSHFGLSEAPEGMYFWILTYSVNNPLTRSEDELKPKTMKGYVQLAR
ncbi:MAG: gliding motility-associated C-terminal domain-containing protein [Cytophagales bacterium]|nr:gliding motility-associated C-terminal domain-containing protein [Cytophagales bacterium]